MARPIPDGYHTVTPYLIVNGGAKAIDFYRRAFGAKELRPVKDQFYDDRTGEIEDPFGHKCSIATHKEDLTMEEVRKRAAAQAGK